MTKTINGWKKTGDSFVQKQEDGTYTVIRLECTSERVYLEEYNDIDISDVTKKDFGRMVGDYDYYMTLGTEEEKAAYFAFSEHYCDSIYIVNVDEDDNEIKGVKVEELIAQDLIEIGIIPEGETFEWAS